MRPVLLVPITARFPLGVGDRVDKPGDPRAELLGQHGDGRGPAARRQAVRMVLDRVVSRAAQMTSGSLTP